jgi:hypothetical protein
VTSRWILAVVIASGLTLAGVLLAIVGSFSALTDLGRTARRLRDEVGGLTSDISRERDRVRDRTARRTSSGRGR